MLRLIITTISIFFFISSPAISEIKQLHYPNEVNVLKIDTNKTKTYKRLCKSIGFEYGKKYSYTDFSDIKKRHKIGTDGYDFLLLSTGGNEWDSDAIDKFNKQKSGWKTEYFQNKNLTILYEICFDDSRTFSSIRILKICKGKNQNLHLY